MDIYEVNCRLWKNTLLEAGLNQRSFNLSDLPAGHYILQLIEGQQVSTVRFNKL